MSFSQKNLHKYHIKYSQNFISAPKLSKEIVDLTSINSQDKVIEIGPGKGSLTKFIAAKCSTLIAVEHDFNLYSHLTVELNSNNIKFVNKDFLEFELPRDYKYKVIGNIPFAITTNILKRVLDASNPATDIYLILQKEAALRFLGSALVGQNENLFSLRFKPFYSAKIIKSFKRSDFMPKPKVDVVMLHIKKLERPLINIKDKTLYLDFVTFCFTAWKPNLKEVLKELFNYYQIKEVERTTIDSRLKPTELDFDQWLELFNYFSKNAIFSKRKLIQNVFSKLNNQQNNLVKLNRSRVAVGRHSKNRR